MKSYPFRSATITIDLYPHIQPDTAEFYLQTIRRAAMHIGQVEVTPDPRSFADIPPTASQESRTRHDQERGGT